MNIALHIYLFLSSWWKGLDLLHIYTIVLPKAKLCEESGSENAGLNNMYIHCEM